MLEAARAPAFVEPALAPRDGAAPAELPVVCVQGLGFVGSAMAGVVADARDPHGEPRFCVVGVDLPSADGHAKIDAINAGRLGSPRATRSSRPSSSPRRPRAAT